MHFFTQRRVKQEAAFDLMSRAVIRWAVTPSAALIASIITCISCAWIVTVLFAGWPSSWASEFVVVGLLIAPALALVSAPDLRRSGWNFRLLLATLFSALGFGFFCVAIYSKIHP